jgi:hypothetical protein
MLELGKSLLMIGGWIPGVFKEGDELIPEASTQMSSILGIGMNEEKKRR